MCRTKLTGHSGEGIVIATQADELVDAPLYVKYIPKKDEYRVHVFDNRVIDIQKKGRRKDVEEANFQVRNHANGFVYMREGIDPPNAVTDSALQVMQHVSLHFGAVDVIWNEKHKRAVVLEINTAPGLEGSTIHSYANAFNELRGD